MMYACLSCFKERHTRNFNILSNLFHFFSQHTKGLATLAQQCVQREKIWSSLVNVPWSSHKRLSCCVKRGNDSKYVKMKTLLYCYKEHRHAQPLCKILLQYFFFCSLWAALWLEIRKSLVCHDLFCSLWEDWKLGVGSFHLSSWLLSMKQTLLLYYRHGTFTFVKH